MLDFECEDGELCVESLLDAVTLAATGLLRQLLQGRFLLG